MTRFSATIYPPPGLLREIGLLFALVRCKMGKNLIGSERSI
ncbi:hypothetical protein CLOSTASPAR_03697 [[Clostridium] asparagiforme DSM 15981]|uniref:Uncharacterized protein n=1 Tax=[Clostridium] asparagiforme DSM 15981 TaxID=518636 RepID=C0D355_9FIRM|nr:hypothetical protein CLOSTASPAR_03697 [[Clostridium] asparagiforme DSM 15981]